jgi:hypothetical protein
MAAESGQRANLGMDSLCDATRREAAMRRATTLTFEGFRHDPISSEAEF